MGFNTPTELKTFHSAHGMDNVLDLALEAVSKTTGAQPTLAFIGECYAAGIAAPSTMHKVLRQLVDKGYLEVIATDDARVRPLRVTTAGREYLARWAQGDNRANS